MSTINTNGVDVNYPVPGINNNSQGFRNNFASIKNNLNTAATEISDLQNKVVVKAALDNTVVNNDMNGTLMSNMLTRSFRSTTYNLGNALIGTVRIDVSKGDVQYGTITGDTILQFVGWSPTGTRSNVELQLAVANSAAVVSFPAEIYDYTINNCNGISTLENMKVVSNVATVTAPYGVCQLDYRLSSSDCGNSITIEPYNRPRRVTEVHYRTPATTGFQGDTPGTVAVDANYLYVCTNTFDSTEVIKTVSGTNGTFNEIIVNNVTDLLPDAPVVFTGNVYGGITAGTVYYIKSVVSGNSAITVSETRTAGTADTVVSLSTVAPSANTFAASSFNGTDIWKRVELSTW